MTLRIDERIFSLGETIKTKGKNILKIPVGYFWVEGDYYANSLDSNTFGAIPLALLTAKATYLVWPPSRWSYI